MSAVFINIQCPVCGDDFEIACEYQGAEPDVGIMTGGPIPNDDVPVACEDCGTTFSPEQIAALRNAVARECEEWEPSYEREYE